MGYAYLVFFFLFLTLYSFMTGLSNNDTPRMLGGILFAVIGLYNWVTFQSQAIQEVIKEQNNNE